jgi:hypothetical protein
MEKKYDVHFNDFTHSDSMGWQLTYDECLIYISCWNGTNHGYFNDYKGGTVSIVSEEGTVYEIAVK